VRVCVCVCVCGIFTVVQIPGIPGRPVVNKVIGSKVTIHWAAPDIRGGTKVTHYVIHYGTAFMDSESCVKCMVSRNETSCIISRGIRKNEEYKFAVAAKNKERVGPLSEFSEHMMIPSREGMHFFAFIVRLSKMLVLPPMLCFPEMCAYGFADTYLHISAIFCDTDRIQILISMILHIQLQILIGTKAQASVGQYHDTTVVP